MTQTPTYTITLIDPDSGQQFSQVVAPVLPRFIHIIHDSGDIVVAELSDQPEPSDLSKPTTSFDRVGSAVWVDDDRNALFARRMT